MRLRLRMIVAVGAFAGLVTTLSVNAEEREHAAKPERSTELVLLGTGGGPGIGLARSKSANLLIVDGQTFLIDCGSGTLRQIVNAGSHLRDVQAVFITHHHIDHNADLQPLISTVWFEDGISGLSPPMPVYGPPATEYLVQTSLRFLSVSERIFRAGIPAFPQAKDLFRGKDIKRDGVVYEAGGVRVTAVENAHFTYKSGTSATGQDRSYSYRFDTPSGSIVFTGDTGPSEALKRLARGADILVSEVYDPMAAPPVSAGPIVGQLAFHMTKEHLIPEEVGKMAASAGVGKLVLSHFVAKESATESIVARVRVHYRGVVVAGNDLDRFILAAK